VLPPEPWIQPGVSLSETAPGLVFVSVLPPPILVPEPWLQPGVPLSSAAPGLVFVSVLPPAVLRPPDAWLQSGTPPLPLVVSILPFEPELPLPSVDLGTTPPLVTVSVQTPVISLPPAPWLQLELPFSTPLVSAIPFVGLLPPEPWTQSGATPLPETVVSPLVAGASSPEPWLQAGVPLSSAAPGLVFVSVLPPAVLLPPEPWLQGAQVLILPPTEVASALPSPVLLPPEPWLQAGAAPNEEELGIFVLSILPSTSSLPPEPWLQAGAAPPFELVSLLPFVSVLPPGPWLQEGSLAEPEQSGTLVISILAPRGELPPEPQTAAGVLPPPPIVTVSVASPIPGPPYPPFFTWLQLGVEAPTVVSVLPVPAINPPESTWFQSGVFAPIILSVLPVPEANPPKPVWLQPIPALPPVLRPTVAESVQNPPIPDPDAPSVYAGVIVPSPITAIFKEILLPPEPSWVTYGVTPAEEELGTIVISYLQYRTEPLEPSVIPGAIVPRPPPRPPPIPVRPTPPTMQGGGGIELPFAPILDPCDEDLTRALYGETQRIVPWQKRFEEITNPNEVECVPGAAEPEVHEPVVIVTETEHVFVERDVETVTVDTTVTRESVSEIKEAIRAQGQRSEVALRKVIREALQEERASVVELVKETVRDAVAKEVAPATFAVPVATREDAIVERYLQRQFTRGLSAPAMTPPLPAPAPAPALAPIVLSRTWTTTQVLWMTIGAAAVGILLGVVIASAAEPKPAKPPPGRAKRKRGTL
jgi:hypothetical protein